MKNKRMYLIILTLIMVFTVACSGDQEIIEANQDEVVEVEEVEEKEEVKEVKEEEEVVEEDPVEEEIVEEFKIYSANIDSYDPEVIDEEEISNALEIEEKIKVLGDKLSTEQFADLKIELLEIDSENIAIINLVDDDSLDFTWESDFFQGSTGGILTTTALQETFLQKDYDGEWIDGVKFLYNDEEINFDHVESLSQVKYRN